MTMTNKPSAKASVWNRLPRWLRQSQATLSQAFARKDGSNTVTKEATELHCYYPPQASQPLTYWRGVPYQPNLTFNQPLTAHLATAGKGKLDKQSFMFALEQVPSVEKTTFSGWGEPVSHGDLPDMIKAAVAYNNTVTEVYSHGLFHPDDSALLLQTPLDHLTIQAIAHTPSLTAAVGNHNATPSPLLLKAYQHRMGLIPQLFKQRERYQGSQPATVIDIAMIVDTVTLFHIPGMIAAAHNWGADGIILESRLSLPVIQQHDIEHSPNTIADNHFGPSVSHQLLKRYRQKDKTTLYNNYDQISQQLDKLKEQEWPINVTWPTLYTPEIDLNITDGCEATQQTLSVRPDLTTSNCPRQLAIALPDSNVWEKDAFHSQACGQLRAAHQSNHQHPAQKETSSANNMAPMACYWCPRKP
jgi:hypothetical protein